MIYTLKEPVQLGTETISEITFEKPKGKHMRKMPVEYSSVNDLIPVMCALCNQPSAFFDEVSLEDFQEIMVFLQDFFSSLGGEK